MRALLRLLLLSLLSVSLSFSAGYRKAIFYHHSTGGCFYNRQLLYDSSTPSSVPTVSSEITKYNTVHGYAGTGAVTMAEKWLPADPTGNNWSDWSSSFSGVDLTYPVIIIKTCYLQQQTMHSSADIETLKGYYRNIVTQMKNHPNNFFVIWNNVPCPTDGLSDRAAWSATFSVWCKDVLAQGKDTFGAFPKNVYVFDVFRKLADPVTGYCDPSYGNTGDDHPSNKSVTLVTPQFVNEVFGAAIAYEAPTSTTNILMTPYLQAPMTTQIQVVAECDATASINVDYGLTTSYGNNAITEKYEATTNGTYAHSVRLIGLSPNTLYHYRVNGVTSSPDATFRTAPLPGTPFRFAYLADNRGGGSIYDGIIQKIQAANPVLILHGGDISSDGTYSNVKSEFFTATALGLYSKVPFVLSIGNHEQWTQNPMAFVEAPISASNTMDYYSFDYGDLHVLNMILYNGSNGYYDAGPNSAQYNFALSDIKATTRAWRIVSAHKVPYTNSTDGHVESTEIMPIATNVFEPNGVNVWFGGHNHFYQHSKKNGLDYMTIGSCGAELYQPLNSGSNGATYLKGISTYCYGIIDVTASSFTLRVYNDAGTQIDILTLTKAVPIQMDRFSATFDATSAHLVWSTVSEVNNYGFYIQSSEDTKLWRTLGFVEGHGTTLEPQIYSYVAPPAKFYRLNQTDLNGATHYSEIINGMEVADFRLNQNYPNPFNPNTVITYSLKKTERVRLTVFNILGQIMYETPYTMQEIGQHSIMINGSRFPSGQYIYTLQSESGRLSKRMTLMK